MSSHKGSVVAQGNGAPASNRETDTLELAELGPLLEEKGTRVIANPTKVSCLPGVLPWAVISPQIDHPDTEGRTVWKADSWEDSQRLLCV